MVYGLLTKLIVSGKLKFEEGRIVFTDHFTYIRIDIKRNDIRRNEKRQKGN